MFSLLKIVVSGYKLLKDDFTIDFVSKARVNSTDNEVFEIDKNLYVYNIISFLGSNSSGKTTVLELISKVMSFMRTGRWVYEDFEFNKEKIKLHLEFYLDKTIYSYDCDIIPLEGVIDLAITFPYCNIENEKLKFNSYKTSYGKKYDRMSYIDDDKYATGIPDTSKLIFICKDKISTYVMKPFSGVKTPYFLDFFRLLKVFDDELTSSIIQLLDESIEYIKCNEDNTVAFKRYGNKELIVSRREMLSLLSNGTIKGVELYIRAAMTLHNGGMLIIDEIENCFHKNLVNNIMFLFMDKSINKNNAQLIFTTHYVEIIDILDRRDNINILHKLDCRIEIDNLYESYGTRTELLKSKQFNNNTFNTLLNYDKLMKVKRLLKNEISNND